MHELILGGQKSGKSRCAEQRAAHWLSQPGREAVLLATALPGDDEMRERIARHQADRRERVAALRTEEVPHALPEALRRLAAPHRLLVVDCLTLWLTNLLMPLEGPLQEPLPGAGDPGRPAGVPHGAAWAAREAALCEALRTAAGPVVLVSNEIGLGLTPLGREARQALDALGLLHQRVAAECSRVTLMVAGLPLTLKGMP